ncbi:hypothetical protein D9M72_290550 [compost metagenome]
MVDSPDRHSAAPADWLPRLQELAYDGGRPLAVVATVAALPDHWTGPAAEIGNAVPRPPLDKSFCPDNAGKTAQKSLDVDKNSSPETETEDAK